MQKEFIPYEQALALKELGFDKPCFGYYENGTFIFWYDSVQESELLLNCTAPLYQQAFRWFREKYPDFDFGVGKIYNGSNTYHYHINLIWEYFEGTYEEAELACLNKLIEICKNK